MAIAADYFVDMTVTFEATHANNGLATGTPWGGITGLKRAFDAIAADEVIGVRVGTTSNGVEDHVYLEIAGGAGAFVVGEALTAAGGATARVLSEETIGGTDYIVAEHTNATAFVAGEAVTGDVAGARTLQNPLNDIDWGICHTGASGNMGGGTPIYVIGVNASWDNDGTVVILDGNNTSTFIMSLYTIAGYVWENIEFHDPTTYCVNAAAGNCYYHEWVNCSFNTGTYGVYQSGGNPYFQQFMNCVFHHCTTRGALTINYSNFVGCVVRDNGIGLYINTGSIVDSLLYDNVDGLNTSGNVFIAHCTFDGNTFDVEAFAGPTTIWACRLSNYGTDSIKAAGLCYVRDCWSYFDDDANHDDGGATVNSTFKGASTRIITGIAGHQDRANKQFMVGIGAGGYRTEIEIATDHVLRFCPGLPTMQLPRTGKSGGKQ